LEALDRATSSLKARNVTRSRKTGASPAREIGMVFQKFRTVRHLSAIENIMLGR